MKRTSSIENEHKLNKGIVKQAWMICQQNEKK
jgi:hypothetical protein